jgi:phenylacetaldehyde dehydrogenase
VPLAADLFHYMAGWATKIEGNSINISVPYAPGANFHAYTLREPIGVVGQIIPWNFPLLMAAWKLGPALATGNCVVLKPAEQTPLSALRLAELIAEAGVPDGVVNVVTGFGETAGAALAAHDDVDKVAFTGSTEVGQADHPGRGREPEEAHLELGGKSPNIVFSDVDPEAGHRRCRQRHLLQPRAVLRGRVAAVRPGGPLRRGRQRGGRGRQVDQVGRRDGPDTQMGPLVSDEQLQRVTGYLDSGKSDGATALTGGGRAAIAATSWSPPCSPNPPGHEGGARGDLRPGGGRRPVPEPRRHRRVANDTPYGLGAGIWTKDISKAHALAKKIRAGTVWINCYNIFDAALPFGGYKQSGWGREMGHEALEAYTEVKAVCAQL